MGERARLPASGLLGVSAVFHYLGPAMAVLLFSRVDAWGVAWLRITSAAVVFAAWRRPWRLASRLTAAQLRVLLALGVVLATMNTVFYLAIARLPLATVGAIEFLGVIVLAAAGVRVRRNVLALVLAVCGVYALTDVRLAGSPLGFGLAFANCALFMLYVTLGHRIANTAPPNADPAGTSPQRSRPPNADPHRTGRPDTEPPRTGTLDSEPRRDGRVGGTRWRGVDQLGAAMILAAIVATPAGVAAAAPAFTHAGWLLAGVAVGIFSSVVPYVTDQLAMARLRRSTFALMLSILPACATGIGALVLHQVPTPRDLLGIALVIAGVAIHQPEGAGPERT